jgi:Flp pilus assembly protein TadD
MAERFAATPSIFLCVLIGGAWARLGAGATGWPYGRAALQATAVLLVAALGARTFVRAGDYADDRTLHQATADACPRSAKAQYNLGNALQRERLDEEAVRAFEAATAIAPWLAVAHNNLGTSLLNLRRMEEAERAYRLAAEAGPALFNPRANLAMVLYLGGKLEEAASMAREALALAPTAGDAEEMGELLRRVERRLSGGT